VITIALRLIAPHILDPKSAMLIVFTAVASCIFEQVTISATQVFQAFQHMRFTATLNLLTSLLRTVAAAALLLFTHHASAVQWVVLSMAVSGLAAIVAVVAVTLKFGRPSFDIHLFRSRAGEGVEYAFASSTTSAYDDLDKTMLSHFGMTAAVGVYAMAYRIIEMATMPITSIQLAAEPRLFAFGAAGIRQSAALGRRLLSRSLLVSTASAVVLFFGAPLIPHLVGRGFGEGVSALRWLCLIPVFRSVHHITGSVLTCSGHQRSRTVNQMIAAIVNFLMNLWLIPKHGWLGAAWASLSTDALLGGMNWAVLRYTLNQDAINPAADERTALAVAAQLATEASLPMKESLAKATIKPKVSIVIPYYEQPAYLGKAVQSAKDQGHPDVEIIVVDDGSTVSAQSVLGQDKTITMIRTENRRVSAARNTGFKASSGDFVIFLDSDDVLDKDAVTSHLAAFAANPEAGLSFGALRTIDKTGRQLRPPHICRPRQDYVRVLLGSNPIGCPGGAMIRRGIFEQLEGFDETFLMAEDYLLYLRLSLRAPIVRHTHCVVAYRFHSSSISQDQSSQMRWTMAALDQIEHSLSPAQRKNLAYSRRRWKHFFLRQDGIRYWVKGLYYSFRAMLTVPISSLIRQESSSNPVE
jgi:glycosyltransferase involved in cell wall biosynthesis/Na+-driven multidrug efflux pump